MKKLLVAIVGCALAMTLSASAADHAKLTDEQKAFKKEMIEKYDANKDGKLDKEERAKMTQDEKDKWAKLFPKKAEEKKADDKK
jgi:hypothetical protein